MPTTIHIDFETYSECDIKLGAYRYAADSSTEILMAAVALNDGEPYVWVPNQYGQSDSEAIQIMEMWEDESVEVYAHNVTFEIAICEYLLEKSVGVVKPKIHQWRCTMAMAMKAALPASLDKISKELQLVEQKDSTGKRLINFFSKPTKKGPHFRNTPEEHPEKFLQFIEYCRQDVKTEMEVEKCLRPFSLKNMDLKAFQFTNRTNLRGVPVNVEALQHAQKIIDSVNSDLEKEFVEITKLRPSQNVALKNFFVEHSYPYQSMDVEHTGKALSDTVWCKDKKLIRALRIRRKLGFAAVKKVTSMLKCACPDGYVRGTLKYYGAFRTGRWSGSLIQTQNFKRPILKAKDNAHAYEMICNLEPRENIEMMYGDCFETIASVIRHFIQPKDGRVLFDADYAGIEARVVCWLAGQKDALEEFEKGQDSYIKMCLKIFPGTTEQEQLDAKKRDESTIERFVGKQAVLGCGFGMGKDKFKITCEGYGQSLDEELCARAVQAYRSKYSKVVSLWYACEHAARSAIAKPGITFRAGKHLTYTVVKVSSILFLVCKLPSGRALVYPRPKIENTGKFGDEITFYGPRPKGGWGRIGTFGGKLVENCTQAVATDIMAFGSCNSEQSGYCISTLIHDQGLAIAYPELGQSIEQFCSLLSELPEWAKGLPVLAEGKVTKYYVK